MDGFAASACLARKTLAFERSRDAFSLVILADCGVRFVVCLELEAAKKGLGGREERQRECPLRGRAVVKVTEKCLDILGICRHHDAFLRVKVAIDGIKGLHKLKKPSEPPVQVHPEPRIIGLKGYHK